MKSIEIHRITFLAKLDEDEEIISVKNGILKTTKKEIECAPSKQKT